MITYAHTRSFILYICLVLALHELTGTTPLAAQGYAPISSQQRYSHVQYEASMQPCTLAVLASNFGGHWALYLVQPYAQRVWEISPPNVVDRYPTWSPDGKSIAFERRAGNNWDIYVLDVASTLPRRLTDHPAFDGAPSWSPDGQTIAFESMRDGNLEIYTVSRTGGPVTRVTTNTVADVEPVWPPSGDALLISSWDEGTRGLKHLRLADGYTTSIPHYGAEELQPTTGAHTQNWAYTAFIKQEAHIIESGSGTRAPIDLSGAGHHDEWPTWDAISRTWVALRLVGGNRYEYPRGWVLIALGQPSHQLPLFLPGEWQHPSCATMTLSEQVLGQYHEVSKKELWAVGQRSQADAPNGLGALSGVQALQPTLAHAVIGSFMQLRQTIAHESGHDVLAVLNDAWRDISTPSGSTFSWHKAGRAIDMCFSMEDAQGRPLIYLAKEELRGETYFRLYIRATKQDGTQGEPIRQTLWVLDSHERSASPTAAGGRPYAPSSGYFIDFTDVAQQAGWVRISADTEPGHDWKHDFQALEYWHYERRDGLCWYAAMKRIYPQARLDTWIDYDELLAEGRTRSELTYFCVPSRPSFARLRRA